ncbi:hypothetical protein FD15_GL001834 [Liquorilactobacillus sucicola DSM 21376 = JCM 15457]|uniref:CAP-associated domain-containing protein n=1 Tax=Liquorilactobacillus sucicola DSM 21376 = JCM 15457 TaxID=1423806 RepID=A0A0R2DNU2_9LACO|nr:CAP-associated domain-containing protein [Liquorilactobacillus sucicola]KRN05286.1 hypothetical protein FD15_GL001834 [Liquorilactobacillus sucicola DSM 21376 = JCM 15457]
MRKKFFLKGIVEFGILFLLILTALYCWTALFGNTLPQKNQNTEKRMVTDKARLTTPKVERIKPQGFARYIGTSDDTILNSFGEPQEKLPSATNVEWWVYRESEEQYFKVGIDLATRKVNAIFVGGRDTLGYKGLRVDMPFKKLVQLSSLYANFKLNYHEQSFQLELSEDDLNERPLLSFKNNSYAITYLHPHSKRVYAIEYLNTDMLLKKNIFRIVSQTPLPVQFQGETDWAAMNDMLPADLVRLINVKRSLAGTPALIPDDELTSASQTVLNELGSNPREFLDKKRSRLVKDILNGNLNQRQGLYLYSQGIPKKMYQITGLTRSDFDIYCLAPIYDNSSFFSDSVLLRLIFPKLVSANTKNIGVAYNRGVLVFIINK